MVTTVNLDSWKFESITKWDV